MPRIRKAPVAAEMIEPEDMTPPTEDIVIELPDDGPLEAATIDLAPPVEKRTEPAPTDDDAVKRAVEAQARAEELTRNAQRERDEARRREREREEELAVERADREDAQYNSVLTSIAAEQSAMEKAQADYAAFAAAGDWTSAGNAQREMAVAAARIDRLGDGKRAFDNKREAAKTAPPQKTSPQPAAQDFEQRIAQFPDQAKTWLRAHPEFINDATKTDEIGTAHAYIVNRKKIQAFSQAYFDALDTEFGFKEALQQREPEPQHQPQRRSIPVAAPVSRDVPSASGRREPATMTLTPEERAIARNSFGPVNGKDLTNAEKEYLYAQNKAKLRRMRANGDYRHTTEQTG